MSNNHFPLQDQKPLRNPDLNSNHFDGQEPIAKNKKFGSLIALIIVVISLAISNFFGSLIPGPVDNFLLDLANFAFAYWLARQGLDINQLGRKS